jgi:hypothetical protein
MINMKEIAIILIAISLLLTIIRSRKTVHKRAIIFVEFACGITGIILAVLAYLP